MIKNDIRPYEISLWTLQDSFITVLKPINLYNKGHFETPKITIKDDGTQELSFKVPMYYYDGSQRIENPIWYDFKNGTLMVNLRKLKVIFNKGEKDLEEVFEFVINKVTETHNDGQLYCEVEAEGLAFQELGKIGYKLSLDEDTFINDYEKDENLIASLDYWCEKIFKNSKWNYEVQMDWTGYSGRENNKIYEDEYVNSWYDTDSGLAPQEMIQAKEKARIISVDKSNLYNITQDIAETFGIFCKYKYDYDKNYHIIKRTCIFYNNFLNEKEGHYDINYPFDSSKIERELDSSDVVTKLFVVPVEDETAPSGLITIADVAAHKSHEDYILNFDYLYSIGTITDEQYNAIPDYERAMFVYNTELIPLATQIAKMETDINEYKAQATISTTAQTYDKEQMEQATALMDAITDGTGILVKNESTPYRATILQNTDGGNYVKVSQEGVDAATIKIYYYQKVTDTSIDRNWAEYSGSYSIDKDEYGNVYQISGITIPEDTYSNVLYLTFSYRPRMQYENIYNTFATQLAKDEAAEKEANDKIEKLTEKLEETQNRYNSLLTEKEETIADFERMMGPALREGSWQADDYSDYGTNYNAIIQLTTTGSYIAAEGADNLHFIWDDDLFDEEEKNYSLGISEEEGVEAKQYYPAINISNYLGNIKDNLDDLSVIFNGTKQSATIGSELQFGFFKNRNTNITFPVLLVTKTLADTELEYLKKDGFIGTISATADETGVKVNTTTLVSHEDIVFIDNPEQYDFVYPRLEINSLLLKTAEDEFSISYNNEKLEKFYDYSMLIKDDKYYVTLKSEVILRDAVLNKTLKVSYRISNAALSLYLDALEVSKINAFPQTSYTVDVSALNHSFIKNAYRTLGRVVSINDADLKLSNVRGYISELELDLDKCWEDKVTIKNYKTKFEDLFSSIVASTEQMKTNSYSYNLAASAFTSGGTLKTDVIQNTLSSVDLSYAFQNGNLTIDELNGIWATSDSGVVAMRGGGIFCATQKDQYGNWVWNTGITPSGINASLLKAGQIDTNLIKIYAGDNLRFQLNADGVFAYRQDTAGEAKVNEYVVHNSDGLFLTQSGTDRVEISWDGLILRDQDGNKVFYADENGNLAITGTISAKEGDIGGWQVKEGYLQSKDGNAMLQSTNPNPAIGGLYTILYVRGDTTDTQNDYFKVESDGTLFANNAVIKGTLSAGSVIGNSTADSVVGAVKKLDIVSFNGDSFKLYNKNLDGYITADPGWLRFQIKTNGLTSTELGTSNYEFYIKAAGDKILEAALQEDVSEWRQITPSDDSETVFSFSDNNLTFIVKRGIIIEGEDLIYFRVVKKGKVLSLDTDGNPVKNSDGSLVYEDTEYTTGISLRVQDFGTDKFLSLIEPSSYTFVGSQDVAYGEPAVFKVYLKNINSTDGTWSLSGVEEEADSVLVGNEEPKEVSALKYESIIAIPDINLTSGQWYIDDVLVQSGDTINADDDFETEGEDGSIVIADLEPQITIENHDNGDGTGYSQITVPHQKVPEGGQIVLRYTIEDETSQVSASRTAFVFKIKNGTDSYVTHISSSAGLTFTNGNGETTLEAQLYAGITQLNATKQYYYLWQKKDSETDNYTIVPYRSLLTSKTMKVSAADIAKTATYICDLYDNKEEVEKLFNEKYGETFNSPED